MAGDTVKARIVVDATGAIKEVEELSEKLNYSSKTTSQFAKDLAKANKEFKNTEKSAFNSGNSLEKQVELCKQLPQLREDQVASEKNLFLAIQRSHQEMELQGITIKDLNKEIVEYRKIQKALWDSGDIDNAQKLNSIIRERESEVLKLDNAEKKLNNTLSTQKKASNEQLTFFQKYTKKLGELVGNIMGFQLVIAIVRKGLTAITNTLKESSQASAELEQVMSKLSTVFEGFSDSASRAAETLASKIGVATSTAASSLSTIGDLLQAQGMGTAESLATATRWAEQFQDIIAFKDINMSLEEFADNFMSGAAGNLRNFRTFGSIVKESAVNAELAKQGLDKLTGSQLELAKMTTRAELALSQQANAMGATEREWETALSVQRRLTEAQKEWKENLGDSINEVLKPLRKWWTEVLETTNKANKAMKLYAEGMKEINVYDINNNKNDYQKFLTDIKKSSLQNATGYGNLKFYNKNDTENQNDALQVLEYLDSIITLYGAKAEDAVKILMNNLSDDAKEWLETQEKHRQALIAETKALEDRTQKAESDISKYSSYRETINGITGVRNVGSIGLSSEASASAWASSGLNEQLKKRIEEQTLADAKEAVAQIMDATAETMGKALESSIGNFDTSDLLEMQKSSYEALYEALWNQFHLEDSLGGTSIDDKEQEALDNLIEKYKEINATLDEYEKKLESEKSLQTIGNNVIDEIRKKGLLDNMTARGISSEEANIRVEWLDEISNVMSLFKELGTNTVEINGLMYTQKDLLALLEEKYQGEIDAIEQTIEALQTMKDYMGEKLFSEFEGLQETWKQGTELASGWRIGVDENGNGGTNFSWMGGVMAILAEILSQTEVFQEINSIISDYIVPIFDAFLKPLMPVVETVMDLMQTVVMAFMKPLFPIIKTIAIVINTICGVVNAIWKLMSADWGKKNEEAAKAWDEAMSRNQQIAKLEFNTDSISKNTDKGDEFAYFEKLANKGIINNSELAALLEGYNLGTSNSSRLGNYTTGTNGVQYTTSEVVINVNADNYTAEELVNIFKRAYQESQQAGHV